MAVRGAVRRMSYALGSASSHTEDERMQVSSSSMGTQLEGKNMHKPDIEP